VHTFIPGAIAPSHAWTRREGHHAATVVLMVALTVFEMAIKFALWMGSNSCPIDSAPARA